eukprot:GHVS01025088.1.p1 GENE.GHVS01025088.1~~GHVS01025088.1.p1  ORF type:complete len:906 (-),score=21.17 GHVS01025088.1:153-2870(-)
MKSVVVLQRALRAKKWGVRWCLLRHFTVSASLPPPPPSMSFPFGREKCGPSPDRCLGPTLADGVLVPVHDEAVETPQQYYIKALKHLSSNARKPRDVSGKQDLPDRVPQVPVSWRWVGDNLIRYLSLLSTAQICSVLNLYAKARCRDTSVLFSFAAAIVDRLDKFSNIQLILLLHSIVTHEFHHKILASEVIYTLHSRFSEPCRGQRKEKGQGVHKERSAFDCLDCRTLCLLVSSYAKATKAGMLLVAARHASLSLTRTSQNLEERLCESEVPPDEPSTDRPLLSILLSATLLQVHRFDARDVCMVLVAFSQLEYWDSTLLAALCDRILQINSVELPEILAVTEETATKTVPRARALTFETVSLLINSLSKFMTKQYYGGRGHKFEEDDRVVYNTARALEWRASWLLLQWVQFHGAISQELQSVVTNSLIQDVRSVNVADRPARNQYSGSGILVASTVVCPTLSVERLVNMLGSLASLQPLRQAFRDRNSASALCRNSTRRCFRLAEGVLMSLTREPHSSLCLDRGISYETRPKIVIGGSDLRGNDISCRDYGDLGGSVHSDDSTIFTAQGVSNCLNAFARVQVHCPILFVRLVPTVVHLSKSFEPKHVSMTIAAYAAGLVREKAILQSLCPVLVSAWRSAQATEQDTECLTGRKGLQDVAMKESWGQVASNTLLSLAKLDFHCESLLHLVVFDVLPICVDRLSLQSTVNIIFSLAYFDFFPAACKAQVSPRTEMPRFTYRPHIHSPPRCTQGSMSVFDALGLRVFFLGRKHARDALSSDIEDTIGEPFSEPSTNFGPHSVFSQATQNQLRIAAASLQYPSVQHLQVLAKISVDRECFDWFMELWGPATHHDKTRQATQLFPHVRTSELHREVLCALRSLQMLFVAELYVDPYHIDIVLPPDIKE